MQGRFKNFNEDKGFGFIMGEDGNDYFAHISEVKSVALPYRGAEAEFSPSENSKGKAAKNIVILGTQRINNPGFIQIGGVRYKLNNIKSYKAVRTYNPPARVSGIGPSIELAVGEDGWPAGDHDYLCIIEYQGKENRFYQRDVSFDVYEAAQKLDELLGNIIKIT